MEKYKCPSCHSELESALPEPLANLKVSVVMPVYNEEATIGKIVQRVLDIPLNMELIIVDDASTDRTREILDTIDENRVRKFRHEKNMGKSAALKTGFRHVMGDVVIIQDADLEYNPKDYFKLLAPIADGNADVVYGSRFIGEPHRVLLFWHFVGNKLITFLMNMLCNLNLTDSSTCYKVFRADILDKLSFQSKKFGWDAEFTIKAARLGSRFYEVAISYFGRCYQSGKKITWWDGIKTIFQIFHHALFSKLKRMRDVQARCVEPELIQRPQTSLHLSSHISSILPNSPSMKEIEPSQR